MDEEGKGKVTAVEHIAMATRAAYHPNTEPKPFTYAVFIDELRVLIATGRDLPIAERKWDALGFKSWKHSLSDLVARIREKPESVTNHPSDRFQVAV